MVEEAESPAVRVEDQKEDASPAEEVTDENGTRLNWTDEMRTQFPDTTVDGKGIDRSDEQKQDEEENEGEIPDQVVELDPER